MPGAVFTLSDGTGSNSNAVHTVCASVSSNNNRRGAVFDSSFDFGADTFRMLCTCRIMPHDGTSSFADFA